MAPSVLIVSVKIEATIKVIFVAVVMDEEVAGGVECVRCVRCQFNLYIYF